MPIETARAIGKLGFRRWYERQLIESHVWLVTGLLCGFTILALLEMVELRGLGVIVMTGTAILAATFLCWHGLRRYLMLLSEAEHVAGQTTCPQCRTYARFRVVDLNARMRVCCRHCAHEWVID